MKKRILAIVGSASKNSGNLAIIRRVIALSPPDMSWEVFEGLRELPHFDPEASAGQAPGRVAEFRKLVETSAAVLISQPEYIFSMPAGLKNAIEWCVATEVFTDKPVGIITASLGGQKAHEELTLIINTVQAKTTPGCALLIPAIKSKVNANGEVTDVATDEALAHFAANFREFIEETSPFKP